MNVLCVIAARGGSKQVPGKNIYPFLGKPLISWTIEQALACPKITRVIVSTDDKKIADVARKNGAEVPFLRPRELASDQSGKWEVWQHALKSVEEGLRWPVDLFVDLDCTSPLRDVEDISLAIQQLLASPKEVDAVFGVCEARKNPYFNMVEYKGDYLQISKPSSEPIVRRQDAPKVYEHIASIYVLRPEYLRRGTGLLSGRTQGYLLAPQKGFDIDTKTDLELAEFLMKQKLLLV